MSNVKYLKLNYKFKNGIVAKDKEKNEIFIHLNFLKVKILTDKKYKNFSNLKDYLYHKCEEHKLEIVKCSKNLTDLVICFKILKKVDKVIAEYKEKSVYDFIINYEDKSEIVASTILFNDKFVAKFKHE